MANELDFRWDRPDKIVSDLTALLKARGRAIERVPERAIRRGIFELDRRIKEEFRKLVRPTRPRDKDGKIIQSSARSIISTLVVKIDRQSDGTVIATVGTHMLLARWLEEGTGLHGPLKRRYLIQAKNRKALFWGKYDGVIKSGPNAGKPKPIMAKKVWHPGMRPRQPFGKAIAGFLPRYVEIVLEELDREARR